VHFPDSVARGRDYYTPYRALLPKKVEQLLVAGRHYSATSTAQKTSREIPPCMAMGEAVGIAAAMALDAGLSGFAPGGFHLTHHLLLLAGVVAAFLAARRVAGGAIGPLVASLVFALHPIHYAPLPIAARRAVLRPNRKRNEGTGCGGGDAIGQPGGQPQRVASWRFGPQSLPAR
jgi:hypothetical protein